MNTGTKIQQHSNSNNHKTMSSLQTNRCILYKSYDKDYPYIQELFVDKDVRRFLGGPVLYEDLDNKIQEIIKPEKHNHYWSVRLLETNTFIGLISITPYHDNDLLEISYQFHPSFWKNGFAYEVLNAILIYAKDTINLNKILAEKQIMNTDSCKLLEKLGMKEVKKLIRFGKTQVLYSKIL